MHQVSVEDLGNGVLRFKYKWDSTTGDLADLGNCSIREKVDYPGGNPYQWPSPPWGLEICAVPNPTLAPNPPIPGTDGALQDTHGACPNFTIPYQAASFVAMQVYQYQCSCMENWETLLGIGPIYRFVTGEEGGLWRYSIIKSGEYAEIFPLP